MENRRRAGPHPLIIFCAVLLWQLAQSRSWGITFAEAEGWEDFTRLLQWLAGEATTAETWFGEERPSPAKILSGAGALLFGAGPFGLRAGPALLFAAAMSVVYSTLRRPRGASAALIVIAYFALAPPFSALLAQATNDSVAASLVLTILCLAAKAGSTRQWLAIGVLAGVAIGAKISAVIVVVAVLIWARTCRPAGSISRKDAVVFCVAVLVGFLATWPVLVLRPGAAIEHIAHFSDAAKFPRPPALFLGLNDGRGNPPWYYGPAWLVIGCPVSMLLLAAREFFGRPTPFSKLLLLHGAVGLVAACVAHAFLREGLRHLLPWAVIMPLAAGLGASRIQRGPRSAVLLLAVVLALSTVAARDLAPAESAHVNLLFQSAQSRTENALPVTSSGDILTDDVLRKLPKGIYLVVPGRAAERSTDFGSPAWRRLVGERASRLTGREIAFGSSEIADRILVFGQGRRLPAILPLREEVIMERNGIVYVSMLANLKKGAGAGNLH